MSEPDVVVAAEAPTSTAAAAESVIDAFDATETTGTDISGETPTPSAEPSTTPAVVEPPLSEEEALLAEYGFKQAFKPDGREHYIARSKVLKMIGSGLKRGLEKWTGEKTTLETKATELQAHLERLAAGVRGDPKAFLAEIAQHDPRYQAFLEPPAAPAAPVVAEMPAPDLSLPDGSKTYSLDGIQKLLDWKAGQIAAQFEAKLKPLTEREQREAQRSAQAAQASAAQQRVQQQMTEAQTWPLFGPIAADKTLTPFQQEVMAAYMADKSLDLRGAYMKVALPRLTEDDNAKRARLVKELQAAPMGTAVPRSGGDTPRTPGPRTTAEIAAATLAKLERGG